MLGLNVKHVKSCAYTHPPALKTKTFHGFGQSSIVHWDKVKIFLINILPLNLLVHTAALFNDNGLEITQPFNLFQVRTPKIDTFIMSHVGGLVGAQAVVLNLGGCGHVYVHSPPHVFKERATLLAVVGHNKELGDVRKSPPLGGWRCGV